LESVVTFYTTKILSRIGRFADALNPYAETFRFVVSGEDSSQFPNWKCDLVRDAGFEPATCRRSDRSER